MAAEMDWKPLEQSWFDQTTRPDERAQYIEQKLNFELDSFSFAESKPFRRDFMSSPLQQKIQS
jgi:hypothetical protein